MSAPAAEDNPLFRIATLLDDLKHDEINVRVNSMRHLKEITEALGQERTRDELLPFLGDTVMDDEDEVLLVAAEEFGDLVDQVGGVEYIPCLLQVLEELASVDEPLVRKKAVESIYKLVPLMKKGAVADHFIPIVRRLAEKDWFTARSAACALFAAGYPYVSQEIKAELRGLFGALCKDDTPTVRRAAAEHIGAFAKVIKPEVMKEEIYPLFQDLAEDPQDSIRLHTVVNVIAFARLEKLQEKKQEVLKMVFTLAEDEAWRVKWTVANNFHDIAALVVGNNVESEFPRFIRLYVRLLVDEEPEVKSAAVSKLKDVGNTFKDTESGAELFAENIIPELKALVTDTTQFVRVSVASVILGLAPVVGKAKTTEFLVPLILELLRDSDSEVRLNLIGSLDSMRGIISVELISDSLLSSVNELANDSQWRIRNNVIDHMPLLAKHLGQEKFDDQLVNVCLDWLQDDVYSIREAATQNLRKLTQLYGEQWAKTQLFWKITELAEAPGYLFRMQTLRSVEALADVVSSDALNTELLPLVLQLGNDPIPNIKFNVAKCLEKIAPKLTAGVLANDVTPVLKTLKVDADDDVKYYANKCLKSLEDLK